MPTSPRGSGGPDASLFVRPLLHIAVDPWMRDQIGHDDLGRLPSPDCYAFYEPRPAQARRHVVAAMAKRMPPSVGRGHAPML